MRSKSWRWLRVRIEGLLTVPPIITYRPDGRYIRVQQTRLAFALAPPDLDMPYDDDGHR